MLSEVYSSPQQGEIGRAIEPRATLAPTLAKPPFFPEIGTTSVDQLGHLITLTAFVAQAILAEASLSFLARHAGADRGLGPDAVEQRR
jgi:hypothetical protein